MKKVTPEYKMINKGHYSPGMVSNGLLFVSGQLSIDPDTRKVADGGLKEHSIQALNNLDRVLKEAGLTRESVVQCRVYITDMEHWEEFNTIYGEFFGDHKPARAVVPVPELHFGCLVEIEAVAEL
ncbi:MULTISPECIES: RidA family protein [Gudongella]|jgi:reactive intermediate/imine deaminase|uniref:RidA family protein n=1 Tax=Gudongella oleilytica TaxID=1582259 RepID=UPI002A36D5C1|nr:RidA family protein [Gudongella oleilytica]MDY0257400.1 RidA family protein [Gudongella oleilytica]